MQVDDLFAEATADISACGRYRYDLRRIWDRRTLPALFIMLNPSTADAVTDDPTIRRCIGFAHAWGMGGIVVKNLFAFRATKPSDLLLANDPIGPRNLQIGIGNASLIIVSWGGHAERGIIKDRADYVLNTLWSHRKRVHCLGTTLNGCPRHPLYLAKGIKPRLYPE